MPISKKENAEEKRAGSKIRFYAIITLILLLLAILSTLAVPKSSGLRGCLGIILPQSKYSCLSNLAYSTKNASVCGYIPSADQCYAGVAKETLNASTCSSAHDNGISSGCVIYIANATNSSSTCGYLSGASFSSCTTKIALKLGSVSGCSGIADPDARIVCVSSIYMKAAIKNGQPWLCGNVTNATYANLTGRIVSNSSYAASDLSSFFNINILGFTRLSNASSSARDLCYLQSVSSNSILAAYCKSISSPTLRQICNSSTAVLPINTTIAPNNASLLSGCNQFGSYAANCKNLILISQAVITKNTSICKQFTDTSYLYQCYSSLAKAYNNSAYCAFITNATANGACVSGMRYNIS